MGRPFLDRLRLIFDMNESNKIFLSYMDAILDTCEGGVGAAQPPQHVIHVLRRHASGLY